MAQKSSVMWRLAGVLLPVVGWAGGAFGADPAPSPVTDAPAAVSTEDAAPVPGPWSFQLTPYGWLPAVSGSIKGPRGRSLSLDKSIGDVLQDLNLAAMGAAIVRYERLGMMLDVDYASFSVDGKFGKLVPRPYSASLSTVFVTVAGMVRVVDNPSFNADLVGGARILFASAETHVTSILGRRRSRSDNQTNVDGIIGARATGVLGSGFSLIGYGDIGTGDSKLTWQALGALEYAFNDTVSGLVGYRYLGYEFDNKKSTKSLGLSGPIVGLSFRF